MPVSFSLKIGGFLLLPSYSAAQFTIDDVEVLVVLLDGSFACGTPEQRRELHEKLEACAARAGLGENVVAVWRDAAGRTQFLAPPEQHAFFQIVSYTQLEAQVDRKLECE